MRAWRHHRGPGDGDLRGLWRDVSADDLEEAVRRRRLRASDRGGGVAGGPGGREVLASALGSGQVAEWSSTSTTRAPATGSLKVQPESVVCQSAVRLLEVRCG